MKKISIHQIISLIFFLVSVSVNAQKMDELRRSNPEAEGISSKGIISFLEAAENSKHELHSFMFLRHGKVIAEGWWNPYRPEIKHTMYSVSKSFTATAVGFAVSEGLLNVNDKVISFFPNDLPDTISPYLSMLTVKDVLSMSVGQDPDPTFTVNSRDSNWVKGFLAAPILNKPGTKFLYNSLGTYMLSAIVQKVTGKKIIDYLTPRLFQPLGIQEMDWEVSPQGINTGGWGLRIRTEDMARFGQLFLQKGNWNGKQILPEEWIREATTLKILQHPDLPQSKRDSSDWEQGYCYQMWRSRHNSYRGDGAFGQFIIVMPDQDVVIAITAETPDMQDELNLVWKYLLPAIHKESLPANEKTLTTLRKKLSSLAIPPPAKSINSTTTGMHLSGKTFEMQPNENNINTLSFMLNDSICYVSINTDTAAHRIAFGSGVWLNGKTTKRGPYLVSKAKANLVGLEPFKIAGSYRWKDIYTLELTLRYTESPHTEKIICHFDKENISVDFQNSFDRGSKSVKVNGSLKE